MALQELEYDYKEFQQANAGDDRLFVVFFNHYTLNQQRSDEEGRPIYDDEVYVRLITPGDRNNIVERPIRPDDKRRFPRQWAAFKQGEEEVGEGTRLEQWPQLSRAQVEELRYFGFRTVEHLAQARDDVVQRMSGLTALREKAKLFLDYTKGVAPLSKLESENAALKEQLAAMQNQLNELSKRVPMPKEGVPVAAPAKK